MGDDELPALETRDLCRSFGKVVAVDHLDLRVPKGKIYGFLGANGAGKTTTIRMLMGILPPTSGGIAVAGTWGSRVPMSARQKLSYVSQEQFFYPWMKPNQLGSFVRGFYKSWSHKEYRRLLQLFEIPPKRRVEQLSGGMKTKLALALSMAARPEILILDEPTTGLDPLARREFMDLVVEQSRDHGRTTFFSSHLVNEVERCADVVGIIDRGKLRYEGELTAMADLVRRVILPPGIPVQLPAGLVEIWKETQIEGSGSELVLRACGDDWESVASALPPGTKVFPLRLEEAFLATVSRNHQLTAA